MGLVATAEPAVLFQLEPVAVMLAVLRGVVVPALALVAG
jgi:hypothetical protein